jgi:hypothetical protein
MTRTIEFHVEEGDITEFVADVIAVKYAQGFHGADAAIANLLDAKGISREGLQTEIGKYQVVETQRAIKAPLVIFVGTPYLRNFSYPQVREFTQKVLAAVQADAPAARHLAMTIHGSNMGLDEVESFLTQLRACYDAIRDGKVSSALERISIVEQSFRRVELLRLALVTEMAKHTNEAKQVPDGGYRLTVGQTAATSDTPTRSDPSAHAAEKKAYVFVAMPFSDEMTDVYNYGIQKPVREADYLCGRVDYHSFTGDIMVKIKELIARSTFVIADLTGQNANVYLELGYAWGLGKQAILTLRRSSDITKDLGFDVRGQHCLIYKNITELEGQMAKEIKELKLEQGKAPIA